jgi:hypothetical protein
MVTVLESVEYDVELPEGVFDLPDEIKALLLQQEDLEQPESAEEAPAGTS